jgi:hypothetical protein
VSLCTVEILANPIAIQKRQTTGNPSSTTYKPSKPKNCIGPVKFSEVEVSSADKSIIFLVKGTSSVKIDKATSNLYGFFLM